MGPIDIKWVDLCDSTKWMFKGIFFTQDMKMVVQWIACKTLMMYQL